MNAIENTEPGARAAGIPPSAATHPSHVAAPCRECPSRRLDPSTNVGLERFDPRADPGLIHTHLHATLNQPCPESRA